jgi:hypothetical protein
MQYRKLRLEFAYIGRRKGPDHGQSLEISVSNDIQKGMNMVGEVKKLIDAPST